MLALAFMALPQPWRQATLTPFRFAVEADYDPAPAVSRLWALGRAWMAGDGLLTGSRTVAGGEPGEVLPVLAGGLPDPSGQEDNPASLGDTGAPSPGPEPATPEPAGAAPSWRRPVEGRVISWYGWRVRTGGPREWHAGLDFMGREGEGVRAAAAGVVGKVGEEPAGLGRFLVIDHGGGWESFYAHADEILVARGQQVSAGQLVATIGLSGKTTAPHLYWEIRRVGRAVDPAPLLGLTGQGRGARP